MRGRRLGDRVSENAPHPHFVSPSPRKKTRGEGLSTGKMLWLRLCRAVPHSKQLQKHHIRHESRLCIASDRLADVQTQQRSVRTDRLPRDAEALERLAL